MVLPAIAFVALLVPLVQGGGADAAQNGHPALSRLLERVEQALSL